MYSTDLQIINKICNWLRQQHEVVLFTVVQTWGSSPRPAGSMLAICANGKVNGSVSGGCVDDDLIRRVNNGEFNHCVPHFIHYGETPAAQTKFGLPCGGALKLLVEATLSFDQFNLIAEKLAQRQRITRRVCLTTHESSLHPTQNIQPLTSDEHNIYRNFGPAWRMLLIGAGELSQCVSTLAAMFDYAITVCDPRDTYQSSWPLTHITLTAEMPDDLLHQQPADANSIILALSHDPKLDDMALLTALQQNAFYVGALGSQQSNANRRQRLLQLGLTPDQIECLHGPVGLDLGSRTPAEIALAILADITARRHGKLLVATS